jgi:hypothetical protein
MELLIISKIWGFHGGDYEKWRLCVVTLCGSCKNPDEGGAKFLQNMVSYNSYSA